MLSDIVASEGLGRVVPPAQPRAVAQAMLDVIRDEKSGELRRRIATVAQRFTWERVSEPLLAYCGAPWKNRHPDDGDDYVHKLERLYTETAAYARTLEATVEEKNAALEGLASSDASNDPWSRRLNIWKRRG